jgi:uncharacterized protein DUF3108
MRKITPTAAATAAVALAAGLALAGCGSSGSSSASGSASGSATRSATGAGATASTTSGSVTTSASVPFPVAAGNTWTYDVTAGGESGTTVNKMTAVTPVAGGQQVTMATTDHLAGANVSRTATYIFHSDGSISYPLAPLLAGSGVTVTSGGDVDWPAASVIAAGTPTRYDLKLSIKVAGQTMTPAAQITVQGAGTATVTVPAGTFQATVVLVTERISIDGITVSIDVKTWFAPGVGPVKDQVVTDDGSASTIAANEELVSFAKG